MLAIATGRRSTLYESSNEGLACPPSTAATFQATLCASCRQQQAAGQAFKPSREERRGKAEQGRERERLRRLPQFLGPLSLQGPTAPPPPINKNYKRGARPAHLHACVHAKGTRGREHVRRVAHQQGVTDLQGRSKGQAQRAINFSADRMRAAQRSSRPCPSTLYVFATLPAMVQGRTVLSCKGGGRQGGGGNRWAAAG